MPLSLSVKSEQSGNRPGDTYRATIDLTNPDDYDVVYVVEGVSVKCHGLEILDPGWVSARYYNDVKAPPHKRDNRRVARLLFSAQANQLLDRLLFLAPGQDKTFSLTCVLPDKLPPSFNGTSVRYLYEIQAGVKFRKAAYGERDALRRCVEQQGPQTLYVKKAFAVCPDIFDSAHLSANNGNADESAKDDVPMLEVCFRPLEEVLLQWTEVSDDDKTSSTDGSHLSRVVSESAESSSTMALRLGVTGSAADARSVSRFSASRSSLPETEMSYAPPLRRRTASMTHAETQMLVGMVERPQVFNLRFGSETVVLFSLNPSMARPLTPGSTLGGVLRLSGMEKKTGQEQKWRCQSYTVMLETEEEVAEAWQQDPTQEHQVIRRLHCEHTEFTGDVLMTNFMFTIPSNAPPSFRTPLVTLRWVLKFEFEVGRCFDWAETGDMFLASNETESLSWQLPLTVYPR